MNSPKFGSPNGSLAIKDGLVQIPWVFLLFSPMFSPMMSYVFPAMGFPTGLPGQKTDLGGQEPNLHAPAM